MRALLAAILLMPASMLAQATVITVPQVLGYQGRLLKSDLSAETGLLTITFSIYDQEVGGTLKWHEPQTVALSNGFYAVFLGSVVPFTSDVFDGSTRWLELQIEGDNAPLTPRQEIASVAYALRAAHAVTADTATTLTGTGAAVANLGYTPVQQGTGSRQGSNAVKLGWTGSRLALTVDGNDLGDVLTVGGGTGDVDVEARKVRNVGDPASPQDAATKGYVDGKSLVGTAWCNPGSVPAGTVSGDCSMTIQGAVAGSACAVGTPGDLFLIVQCHVAANRCWISFANMSSRDLAADSGTYTCRVFQ